MEVVRSETAGFCMGVILALEKLDALTATGDREGLLYTLGPIIHNPQVLEMYARKGVRTAELADEIPSGATAVIRAHGVPRQVEESLRGRGVHVVDATCPKVKKAQLLIQRQAAEGRFLLLYGEESHPEVKGLLSYAEAGAFLFDTLEKLRSCELAAGMKYCLAAQTTQARDVFETMADYLAARPDSDVTILQTICDATQRRQEEAVRIAGEVDFMVVAGGFNSGNTRRLVQVVSAQGTPCLHVEKASELPVDTLKRYRRIGLTAGASTPKELIDEINRILEDLS